MKINSIDRSWKNNSFEVFFTLPEYKRNINWTKLELKDEMWFDLSLFPLSSLHSPEIYIIQLLSPQWDIWSGNNLDNSARNHGLIRSVSKYVLVSTDWGSNEGHGGTYDGRWYLSECQMSPTYQAIMWNVIRIMLWNWTMQLFKYKFNSIWRMHSYALINYVRNWTLWKYFLPWGWERSGN